MKESKKDFKKLLNFFYELGQLKRVARSGWWLAGVKNPESVAEHAWRTAAISYILGLMEKANAERCALISLFHEMPECRINDKHKVEQRYIDEKKISEKVLEEQLDSVPKEIGIELKKILEGYGKDLSREQEIARDADYIECTLTAKEYLEQGYKKAQNWIDNCKKCVKTKNAKLLMELIDKSNTEEWYANLKNIKR